MARVPQPLRYVYGDATDPQGDGRKIIAHICNDQGAWGKGFVLALSRRWAEPEVHYKIWHRERQTLYFGLGEVQLVQVANDLWVANMIAQRGLRSNQGRPPIRYQALGVCLGLVMLHAKKLNASVHMPRIGTGLAGGDWNKIEQIILNYLCEAGIPVTVYDLEEAHERR